MWTTCHAIFNKAACADGVVMWCHRFVIIVVICSGSQWQSNQGLQYVVIVGGGADAENREGLMLKMHGVTCDQNHGMKSMFRSKL